MRGDQVREKLHAGGRVYGTHVCGLSNALAARLLASTPLDFAFFCTEHMPLDRSEVSVLCQIYASRGISPIVRIPYPCARQAAMALDGGAEGIVAPYVETVEEVREIVGAVHYRPIKGRLLRQFLDGTRPPSPKTLRFLERFNRQNYAVIGVESVAAYENLDALIGVEGVDGVFMGPHDLSVSLEAPEEWDNPELFRLMKDTVVRCRAAGIGVGVHVPDGLLPADWFPRLMDAGMNWVLYAADVAFAMTALTSQFEKLRRKYGDAYVAGDGRSRAASSCAAPEKVTRRAKRTAERRA